MTYQIGYADFWGVLRSGRMQEPLTSLLEIRGRHGAIS
nr:MAG TPA: hypothetical protein [Caudoviricetes sp.]